MSNFLNTLHKHFAVGRGGPPLGALAKAPAAPTASPTPVLNQALANIKPTGMSPTGMKQGV